MPTEHTTLIVSVNADADEEARLERINAQVGEGWRVVSTVPISGGGSGPGGESEDFLRLQVILDRDIDEDNVVVRDRKDEEGSQPEEMAREAPERPDEPGRAPRPGFDREG